MANKEWVPADDNWALATNYTGGVAPVTTDTIQHTLATRTAPATNLPASGTYNYEFVDAVNSYEVDISAFDAGAAVGTILFSTLDGYIVIEEATGTLTSTLGQFDLNGANAYVVVLNGADASVVAHEGATVQSITDGGAGGTIYGTADESFTIIDALTTGTMDVLLDSGSELITTGGATISNTSTLQMLDDSGNDNIMITGDLTIASGGTFDWSILAAAQIVTVDGNLVVAGVWTGSVEAGAYLIVTGNLHYASATGETNVHVKMTGSGKTINGARYNHHPGSLTFVAGSSVEVTATTYADVIASEVGSTVTGSSLLYVEYMGNNSLDLQGDVSAPVRIRPSSSRSNTGRVHTTGVCTITGRDTTWTCSGVWDCGETIIEGDDTDNEYGKLTLTGASASLGDLTLGKAADINRHGILDVSGVSGAVSIGDLVDAAGGSSALALGAKEITLGGDWDGTNIAVTGSGTVTGDNTMTIDNMGDPGAVITVLGGVTDGGSNHENWIFAQPTPPIPVVPKVTTITSSVINRIGSTDIAAVRNNNYDYMINVVLASSVGFSATTNKLSLYGYPLSLMERGGNYALNVISKNDVLVTDNTYVYNGVRYMLFNYGGNNVYAINNVSGSSVATNSTMWHGVPVSINSDNSMVMVDKRDVVTDETAQLMMGGVPILIGRIDNDWHLIVGKNNS
jgi:hypothetical protein